MYGAKYDKNLTLKDIAKALRADIAAAQKLGADDHWRLPRGIKVSVRTDYFANGKALRVSLTAFPGELMNPAPLLAHELFPQESSSFRFQQYTKDGARCIAVLEGLMQAYNFDHSDSQTDYFHVNFYGHASVDCRLLEAQRTAVRSSLGFSTLLTDLRVGLAGGLEQFARDAIHTMDSGYHRSEERFELRRLLYPEPMNQLSAA